MADVIPSARFELEHKFDEEKRIRVNWLDVALGVLMGTFATLMVLFAF